MYTRTITYTDWNGMERTEEFRFNLTKAELMEMQYEQEGGMREYLDKIIKSNNQKELMRLFKAHPLVHLCMKGNVLSGWPIGMAKQIVDSDDFFVPSDDGLDLLFELMGIGGPNQRVGFLDDHLDAVESDE